MNKLSLLTVAALVIPTLASASNGYVNTAGDTMTGALTINLKGLSTDQVLLTVLGAQKITSKKPVLILNNNLSNRQWQLRNGGLSLGGSSFDIFDSLANKSRFVIDSDGNIAIGTGATALNSRLYIWGGPTGANLDIRGDASVVGGDQSTIELEGGNYDTVPNSIRLQYYGSSNSFGTTMGFPNKKLGVLAWGGASTALIDVQDRIPLIFGTFDKERMRLTESGALAIGTTNPGASMLAVSGSVTISSLKNCSTVQGDSNGTLACGTNVTTNLQQTAGAFGTGNVIAIGDNRYINITGDMMTGMLVLSGANNSEVLRLTNTTSSLTSGIFVGNQNPNGSITASQGSLFIDQVNGAIYAKTFSNGTNNGWSKMTSATGSTLPSRATLWQQESVAVSGNKMGCSIVLNQMYVTDCFQPAATASDSFTNGFSLRAGTYTFSVLGLADKSRGKIDWSIDGVSVVAGQDWYNATTAYNTVKTATVTVTGNGFHTLKGQISGKNAASSNYDMHLTKMWFTPVGGDKPALQ